MNINQVATKLNKEVSEVKAVCNEILGKMPIAFNGNEIAKLEQHFNDFKQLTPSSDPVSNTTASNENKNMTREERRLKREQNRIRAMRQEGESEAIRDFQIKRNAYEKTSEFLATEYDNRENFESDRLHRRSRYIGQGASEVNQIQQAEIIDVTEESNEPIESKKFDLRILLPAKDTTTETKAKFDLRDLL